MKIAALENRPYPPTELMHVWEVFAHVHHSRSQGLSGAGAIPIGEISAYLDMVGYTDRTVRAEITILVLEMDKAYLAYSNSKAS